MKIVLAATHGVGKTSVANALAKELNATCLPDVARDLAPLKGFEINEKTLPEVQLWMAMIQWETEKNTPGIWIADKCLIDYLIYGEIVLRDEKIKDIIRWLVERNAHYDYIFRIPIEFPMVEDGLRSKELQPIIDVRYEEYLDRSGIKYYTLTGSVEERVRQALNYIKNNPPNKR